jgi:hypothetical protein
VFENRLLRRIVRQKRDEVMGWRKLHNEELHNQCTLSSIIRMMKEVEMGVAWGEDQCI